MKICILCNFGPFPENGGSIGGSENVIKNISEILIKQYNCNIDIYAHNYKRTSIYNNINLFPCPQENKLIDKIAHNYNNILVYSCSQWNMSSIIKHIDKIDCKVSICLVGAYFLQSHLDMLKLLKQNINKFNLITHSSITPDYQWCINNDLPVTVIPNGVDLSEFNNSIIFREKNYINKKFILCSISNFFYGKGQPYLIDIGSKLSKLRDDFCIVSISSTIKDYPYEKLFLKRTKDKYKNDFPLYFLRDIPREDVISALLSSDLFIFTSLKEVAPLVIIESIASGLPWISFNVGNVKELDGGVIINCDIKDNKGYLSPSPKNIDNNVDVINKLLDDKTKRQQLVVKKEDRDKFSWDNIVDKYYELFTN